MRLFLLAAALAAAASVFLEGFRIPSRSMEDSLLLGDYLLVEKVTWGALLPGLGRRLPALRPPRPGDLVVFRYPPDPQRTFVKRCAAVAGQTVEVRDKVVYVDGDRLTDPQRSKYLDARILPAGVSPRDNLAPQRVPPGTLFVIGDNRDHSRDSRHWGFLPEDHLVGRPLCICWSAEPVGSAGDGGLWPRLASLPGRIRWQRLGAAAR